MHHTNSSTEIFQADAGDLIKTGYGTVDKNPKKMLSEGNIQYWPQIYRDSYKMQCPEMEKVLDANNDTAALQFSTKVQAPRC